MNLRLQLGKATRSEMRQVWEAIYAKHHFNKAPEDLIDVYFLIYREILSEILLKLLSIGRYHTAIHASIDIGSYSDFMSVCNPVGYWELCEHTDCPVIQEVVNLVNSEDEYDSDDTLDDFVGGALGTSVFTVFDNLRALKKLESLFRAELDELDSGLLASLNEGDSVSIGKSLSSVVVIC